FLCCATVTGYKNVYIDLERVGNSGGIETTRNRQDDDSIVLCGQQKTMFIKSKKKQQQQQFRCALTTDDKISTLSSAIKIKKALVNNEPDVSYTLRQDDRYYPGTTKKTMNKIQRKRLVAGKFFAIIVGAVVGGILISIISVVACIVWRKRASSSLKGVDSRDCQKKNYWALILICRFNNSTNNLLLNYGY
ncbi:unnamed protein product, partial [Didymodactylos carnosus]